MNCEELMTRDVQTIAPTDSVQAAACLMRDEEIGFLPVCQSSGQVLGVLTDRDIAIRIVTENKSADTPVSEVMSDYAVSVRPQDSVYEAAVTMQDNTVSRVMCIDEGGKLVGVISLSDLAQLEGVNGVETLERVSQRETRI